MPRPLGARSPAATLPKPDGSIQAGALDQADVIACQRREHTQKHCGLTMPVDDIVAIYDPGRDALAGRLPETAVFEKWVSHPPVVYDTKVVSAQRVTYIVPQFRIPRADGSCFYEAALPPDIDRQLGISQRLKQQIIRLLASMSVRAVRQMTFAPPGAVEAILETLPWYEGEAMRSAGARPSYLALDAFDAKVQAGQDRPVYHLTASDPAWELHWTLALLEKPFAHKRHKRDKLDKLEKIKKARAEDRAVARLAQAILELPFPEAVLAIATDYGDEERRVAGKVIVEVQRVCPDFQPALVIDRFHAQGCFRDALTKDRVMRGKAQVRGKNGKKLKNASGAAKQREADIKGAANALTKVRKAKLGDKVAAAKRLEKAFEAAPELELGYELLEGIRRIFDCRRVDEAERLYAAWKEELEATGIESFKGPAENLEEEWPHIRRYFEVLEKLDRQSNRVDLKVGSNVVESLNRRARAILDKGGKISIARLEQRLLISQGYIAKAAPRSEPSLPSRKSPKKTEAVD